MPGSTADADTLIALAGTLIVAGVGFYQWRKQSASQSRAVVAETRRAAAQAVWSKTEEVNLLLRDSGEAGASRIAELEREVNATFLKNSLYLEDETQNLVSQYTRSLFQVSALLADGRGDSSRTWNTTGIGFQVSASDSPEVRAALDEANHLRMEVKHALLGATGA